MKILLTGANGLIGQKLKQELLLKPAVQLIATSRSKEINPLQKAYTFEQLDITHPDQVQQCIDTHRPEVIIHTAAQANVNYCEQHKEECYAVNTEAVRTLTEFSNQYNMHLIHFSTDFIFDGKQPPYQENDLPNPVNYYGQTKADAENLLREHANQYTILRPILVFGYFKGMKRDNLVTWVVKSLANRKPIKVVNDQYRCPTLAEDIARLTSEMAGKKQTGVFHICGKESLSIYDLAIRTAEHFQLNTQLITPVTSKELNEIAARPANTCFTLHKIKEAIDYQPTDLDHGLKMIRQQYSKNIH